MAKNADSDTLRFDGQPSEKSKKSGVKDQLPYWRSLDNWVVCLKIPIRANLFYGKGEIWDQITPSNSPRARGTASKIGKERSIARNYSKVRTSWAQSVRSQIWGKNERTQDETLQQERCARRAAWDLAKNVYKLKKYGLKLRFTLLLKPGQCRRRLQETTEEREFVVDSGVSMHVLSKKALSSEELETLRRSRTPMTVGTANKGVQTNGEGQVHVYDIDLFVTVQLLEDTPAVLSLGKLCKEHGYTCEWASGQKPHLTK